jgi:hypothetical protein
VTNLIIVISENGGKIPGNHKIFWKENPQVAKSDHKKKHCLRHPGTMMANHKPVSLNIELALCVG